MSFQTNVSPTPYRNCVLTAIIFVFYISYSLLLLRHPTPVKPPTTHETQRHSLPVNTQWSLDNSLAFCAPLREKPAPADPSCHRNQTSQQCADGKFRMFSQMSQDYYLYTRHFTHLKRRGVYLDVATNNPIGISNTYFLERCLGWSGLCVEANPSYLAAIHRHRECALVPTCVSDKDGRTVTFQLDRGLSGITSTNKNKAEWERKKKAPPPTMRQKCSTVGKEFIRYNITAVDYFSLDVEGHELHVLKGIDWDTVVVNVLTVEAPEPAVKPLEEFLTSKGYIRHTPTLDERSLRTRRLQEDIVFLHKDVVWGEPV